MFSFSDLVELKPFIVVVTFCQDTDSALELITVKKVRVALVLGIDDVNCTSTIFAQKILASLPIFHSARLPSGNLGLNSRLYYR